MKIMKMLGVAALPALFLALLAAPGVAGVLLQEDFRSAPKGKQLGGEVVDVGRAKKGWRAPGGDSFTKRSFIEYRVADLGLRSESGTIEFNVVRDEISETEAIFSLSDDSYKPQFVFRIFWEESWTEFPTIEFYGGDNKRRWHTYRDLGGYPDRVNSIPLPRMVARGEMVHFAVTWNGGGGDIFVDGRKMETFYERPLVLPELIADSTKILIGAETRKHNPQGNYSMTHSAITDFRVHDRALSASALDTPVAGASDAAIASLNHDAARMAGFSGKLVAGDAVAVTIEGTAGSEAAFDVARLADFWGEIPVSWEGWGVYLEDITFFEDGQVDLRDVEEYRVYVSTSPIDGVTLDTPFVEDLEVEQQSIMVDEVSVLDEDGETYSLEALEAGTPYYVAVMARMDDDSLLPVIEPVQGVAMAEVEGAPGSYEGTYTVDYKDRYPEAAVVARLGSGDGQAVVVSDETFAIDATLNIAVVASPEELKADEESESEVTVTVTDANGDPVSGREIQFLLATTSQYTGVVGGGRFTEEVGGSLGREYTATTDLLGQVEMTYTAGFAAKTAIIVARDPASNSTGSGYVKTYITASAELELEAVQQVAGKALGYSITVTSSDEWLTADGKSEARITALVTKDGIPVEGHRIGFSVSGGSGRVRTVQGVTDSDGEARAVYTAGRKIGIVLVRAVDHTVGITGAVQIELRSDAPAKIAITLDPDVLPADGRSTADVEVVVTDINDNPNEGVEVEYEVEIGSGSLRSIDDVTDRRGESAAEYVAGRIPGKVSIKVTVRSTVPTEEEMAEARAMATAVTDYDFF